VLADPSSIEQKPPFLNVYRLDGSKEHSLHADIYDRDTTHQGTHAYPERVYRAESASLGSQGKDKKSYLAL